MVVTKQPLCTDRCLSKVPATPVIRAAKPADSDSLLRDPMAVLL